MSVYDSIPSHFHAELFTLDSLEERDSHECLLTVSRLPSFYFRQRTDLSKENLKHLEKVFRNHLAKDNEEFTLAEFKQIVPSKNVSLHSAAQKSCHCEPRKSKSNHEVRISYFGKYYP